LEDGVPIERGREKAEASEYLEIGRKEDDSDCDQTKRYVWRRFSGKL